MAVPMSGDTPEPPGSLVDWEYWLNQWPDHPIAVTRANAADGYPRPLTPLSQDLILTYEEAGVRKFYFEKLGVLTPADAPDPYMQAFYGLVYLNADQLAGLGEATPGSSRHAMYQQFFGLEADPAYVPPKPTSRDRLREAVTGLKVAPRTLRLAREVGAEVDRRRAAILATRPAGALGELSDAGLAAWLDRLDGLQVESWVTLMTGAGLGSGFFETVRKMLVAWAGDTTGDLCNRLHVALGGNESAEAGRAVRQLAEVVRREGVEDSLEGDDPVGDLRRASPVAAAALDDLLARYGHRAPAELELSNPSWRMDPRPVLDTVRLELKRDASGDDAGAIRTAAEAELAGRVSKVKLPVVKAALKKSQAMMASRENGKLPAVLLWDELRRLLAAAAPRLVERGVLPETAKSGDTPGPRAIHFLRHSELRAVLRGDAGPGLEEIERRREAHRRCLTLDLPELTEVGPGWIRPLDDAFIRARGMLPPEKLAADATRLHGIAAAPGTVTGTARVLFDPFDEFEAGDVLFARTVDPGWAPVLACAGAVVLDIGGVLSHGAVVARELGVPCVVNVKVGTERAVSGSTVTVDGSTGEVLLS
jgi:phosphohistidine swiveling domain-containing protein